MAEFKFVKSKSGVQNLSIAAESGNLVGIMGGSGTGKSTLIKLVLGQLEPTTGTAKTGENLKVGYYSQEHLETLPENSTPLKCLTAKYPLHDYQALEVLRKFYFSKHLVNSKIWTLSGGQKARLQLALFLYSKPDLLILDEPTNHLDLKSVSALEKFLIEYEGAVLLISHDRELLENVADFTYEIKNNRISLV